MKWWGYFIFGLVSLILAPISALCAFFNPFGLMFQAVADPAVRLLGFNPPTGWSSIGSVMTVNFIWPLTLAPLHWMNFRALHWNTWGYAGLFLVINVMITFTVLLVNSSK